MRTALTALAVAGVLGGGLTACGNDKQESPDVTTPGPRLGSNPATYPAAGIAFQAPAGWTVNAGEAPLVTTVATGEATLAIYRYARTQPLPKGKTQLVQALDALEKAARTRDDTFKTIKRARLEVDGNPAVQLRGTETINGQPRTVRSTHIYVNGAEVVVDAFAPDDQFKRVDAQTFRTVLRTLKLTKPQS